VTFDVIANIPKQTDLKGKFGLSSKMAALIG
jgi:hypothetical protein